MKVKSKEGTLPPLTYNVCPYPIRLILSVSMEPSLN